MDLNQYQKLARDTAIYPPSQGLVYTTLGLTGEAGEVAEKVKKMIRDGASLTDVRQSICAELGDVLWYLANLAHECYLTLDEVALKNLQKLSDRKNRQVLKGSGDER